MNSAITPNTIILVKVFSDKFIQILQHLRHNYVINRHSRQLYCYIIYLFISLNRRSFEAICILKSIIEIKRKLSTFKTYYNNKQ